jgi:hypothetical protein
MSHRELDRENPNWRNVLESIPQCLQRQDSLHTQLKDLRRFANKLGFYDAADYLKEKTGD